MVQKKKTVGTVGAPKPAESEIRRLLGHVPGDGTLLAEVVAELEAEKREQRKDALRLAINQLIRLGAEANKNEDAIKAVNQRIDAIENGSEEVQAGLDDVYEKSQACCGPEYGFTGCDRKLHADIAKHWKEKHSGLTLAMYCRLIGCIVPKKLG